MAGEATGGPTVRPYGSWRSPITANMIVAGKIILSQIAVDGDDVYWVEQRPAEAKVQFEKALQVSPLLGQAAMELASLAERAGDWPEAYKQLSWGAITGRIDWGAMLALRTSARPTIHP